jgi:hypothetical protein
VAEAPEATAAAPPPDGNQTDTVRAPDDKPTAEIVRIDRFRKK